MWNRRDVEGLQTQDLPWDRVPATDLGSVGSGRRRVVSEDPDDDAITLVQRFTDRQRGVLISELDLFAVTGSAVLNSRAVRAGRYVHVPAGTTVDLQPQPDGFTAYCGYWGAPTLEPGEAGDPAAIEVVDTDDLSWDMPEWSGETQLETGAAVKWLRREEGAVVYLAAMLPGWKCSLEEAHPVYEESFKLTGTILMGDRGVNVAGGYFFRSPDVFHGPLYSQHGTMSFIRSDAPPTTVYQQPPETRGWRELSAVAYGSDRYLDAL